MDDRTLVRDLLDAFERSLDVERLAADVRRRLADATPVDVPAVAASVAGADRSARDDVLGKLVLADLLDDAILGARPGDKAFALRMLLSRVGEALPDERALTFACALSFYFRASMDEETKLRVGLEVSRLFYGFAAGAGMDKDETRKTAPLLATLMTTELARLRFESVDHASVFDSQLHEREAGSDPESATVLGPRTFLCRVASSDKVRIKAVVRT